MMSVLKRIFMDNADLDSGWSENPVLQYLIKNKKQILTISLGLLAVLILAYKWLSIKTSSAEDDYLTANNRFISFTQNPDNESVLSDLKELLVRHPELAEKYDAAIAQILINRNHAKASLPFAKAALERTENENSPYFSSYAQTTLLIAEKHYMDALPKAISLHKQMVQAKVESPLLIYNLLRIAALQKELNLKNEELKTWQTWKSLALKHKLDHFQIGNVSLNHYIEHRIKELL